MTPVDVDGHAAPGDQERAPDGLEDFDNLDDLDEQQLRLLEEACGTDDIKNFFIAGRKQLNIEVQKSIASIVDRIKGLHIGFDQIRSAVRQGREIREALQQEWEETMANGREVTEVFLRKEHLVGEWEMILHDNLRLSKESLKGMKADVEKLFAGGDKCDIEQIILTKRSHLAQADARRHVKQVQDEFDDICGLAVRTLL